ncbi:MAG TPA: aminopeptidase P family protein [Hyphomonadaceae bacterium]|jgi:Xaa-Pro aminopeptidase|nr:aminopeptidase P family protein [Hyphomonadaceae bacterium]
MRQTYEVIGGPTIGKTNLPVLRATLKSLELDGLYIPHDDEYQNEYLPDCYERLAWATGFTGSAGAAFVFQKTAIVFVDGRYTLQVKHQLAPKLFEVADYVDLGPFGWLAKQKLDGQKIGYDPRTLSPDALDKLKDAAAKSGAALVATDPNPVDTAWTDRPAEPMAMVIPHDIKYSGESSSSKRARIGKMLQDQKIDAVVITSPASIAWLFNVRGGDVSRTPLPLGRAFLFADGQAELFLNPSKVAPDLGAHLGNEVTLRPTHELERRMAKLQGKRVSLDPQLASSWFFGALGKAGAEIARAQDPCTLPRSRKNEVEVEGMRRAHRRDGAALSRFIRWFEAHGQTGEVTEIDCAMKVEEFREKTGELQDLSFNSISSTGPNAAINHYRPDTNTNRKLAKGSLFLLDSGGQYLDGTTDVTRTLAIGEPSEEMKERNTRVLKGHIALARARFPKGTTGSALDILARLPLWEGGFDYDHGTGHGVGSYLGVHEGPQRISKVPNTIALEAGMILSNEPGYYKADAWGIRIENLVVVTEAKPIAGGERDMLGFETLTLAPLDRKLILPGLLTEQEWIWIDRYHARVIAEVGPLMSEDDRAWLAEACKPL